MYASWAKENVTNVMAQSVVILERPLNYHSLCMPNCQSPSQWPLNDVTETTALKKEAHLFPVVFEFFPCTFLCSLSGCCYSPSWLQQIYGTAWNAETRMQNKAIKLSNFLFVYFFFFFFGVIFKYWTRPPQTANHLQTDMCDIKQKKNPQQIT